MEKFIKRTAAPDTNDENFYSNANIFFMAGFSMLPAANNGNASNIQGGNCTAYAYGRLLEQGVKYTKCCGNAGDWFLQAQKAGYPTGQEPLLGSIACWDDHVAVVESVRSHTISESGWNAYIFRVRNLDENWTRTGHELLGFIYPGIDYEPEDATSSGITAGTKVNLSQVDVYASATGASIGTRSGTYYVYSTDVTNGRVRMTNSESRVGVAGQVSFWANVADLGLSSATATETSSAAPAAGEIKAGTKCTLSNTLVYSSATGASVGTRSGIYYINVAETVNNRIRVTSKPEYVGDTTKTSFWIEVKGQKE